MYRMKGWLGTFGGGTVGQGGPIRWERAAKQVWFCLLLSIGLGFASLPAHAEVVRPNDRVNSYLVVYQEPSAGSQRVETLPKGQDAELLGSVPRWYRIRLNNGVVGFVNKAYAQVAAGDLPAHSTSASPQYTIDVIDVGTGLSVLVQGPNFAVLYDAGSNDDVGLGDENRVIAFLKAAWPNLQQIDHVILSHPHKDHVELLADVVQRYAVKNVWDSGRMNDICGYRAFINAAAQKTGLLYHDATHPSGNTSFNFKKRTCARRGSLPEAIAVKAGTPIDPGSPIQLAASATMTFLHASAEDGPDVNDNSLVLRLDLGSRRLLLVGDAGGGGRAAVSDAPKKDSIESQLLQCCAADLKADLLVVGHHGSKTSSRAAFIDAVKAPYYFISSGPKKYSSVTLPDDEVVAFLEGKGDVYRTDRDDDACAEATEKIGAKGGPGGCDNIRITLTDKIDVRYFEIGD